jgi:hypothetical protein
MAKGSALVRRAGILLLVAAALVLAPVSQVASQGPQGGEFIALSYNVAGLPEAISDEEPLTNSPKISPLLNDYDMVLLQESWGDPEEIHDLPNEIRDLPVFFYHHLVVADAEHPYRSEPAPHPFGTDSRRLGVGPTLVADGLNRLSNYPFEAIEIGDDPYDNTVDDLVTRIMWRECFGDLHLTALEEVLGATPLEDFFEEIGVLGHEGLIDGGSADCGAQKGFSVSRTELAPGVAVDVYNLHADAGSHLNDIDARTDNFAQLADFIVEYSEDRAVILGGDTNLRIATDTAEYRRIPEQQVWAEFQEVTGLVDVCTLLLCPLNELAEEFKVHDKFAVRSGGGVEITPLWMEYEREKFSDEDGEPLSDHDPLAVAFSWEVSEFAAPEESDTAAEVAAAALPATGGMGQAAGVAVLLMAGAVLGRMLLCRPRHSGPSR